MKPLRAQGAGTDAERVCRVLSKRCGWVASSGWRTGSSGPEAVKGTHLAVRGCGDE